VTATTTGDALRIELPYPPTGVPTLQLRIGPCDLRFKPSEGLGWISGTYFDPSTIGTIKLPRLDLAISREQPLALDIRAGASDSTFDLGGLPLTRLVMKAGAGRFDVDFSSPNPQPMTLIDLGLGAGTFAARHLANANFGELRLGGGVSACTLDFAGELRRDANARVWTRDSHRSTSSFPRRPRLASS
jgi:hypothetical protein